MTIEELRDNEMRIEDIDEIRIALEIFSEKLEEENEEMTLEEMLDLKENIQGGVDVLEESLENLEIAIEDYFKRMVIDKLK